MTAEEFLTAQRTRLIAIALNVTHNHEDAEDCVQEASIDIWRHWEERDPEKTAGWASCIVHNRGLDMLRKRRSSRRIPARLLTTEFTATEVAVPSGESAVIARLVVVRALEVADLSEHERFALDAYIEGYPAGSKALRCGAWRARTKLRDAIC